MNGVLIQIFKRLRIAAAQLGSGRAGRKKIPFHPTKLPRRIKRVGVGDV